jgi:L-amino acid N-acyltransferase YncA
MSTRIRAATAADIPAITAIYAHAVRFGTASFEIDPPDAAEMGERFAALAAGGFPYLVAATDTGIVGYAYAGRAATGSP